MKLKGSEPLKKNMACGKSIHLLNRNLKGLEHRVQGLN